MTVTFFCHGHYRYRISLSNTNADRILLVLGLPKLKKGLVEVEKLDGLKKTVSSLLLLLRDQGEEPAMIEVRSFNMGEDGGYTLRILSQLLTIINRAQIAQEPILWETYDNKDHNTIRRCHMRSN